MRAQTHVSRLTQVLLPDEGMRSAVVLFAAFCLVAPNIYWLPQYTATVPAFDLHRILLLFTIALCVLVNAREDSPTLGLPHRLRNLWLTGVVATGVTGVLLAPGVFAATGWLQTALILCCTAAVRREFARDKAHATGIAIVLTAAIFLIEYGNLLLMVSAVKSGQYLDFEAFYGRFGHARFYNHMLTWATLPITGFALLRWHTKRRAVAVLAFVTVLLALTGVFVSAGRGSFLSLAIGAGACALVGRRSGRRLGLVLVVMALSAYGVSEWLRAVAFDPHSTSPSLARTSAISIRVELFASAWQQFMNAPLLGNGVGAFTNIEGLVPNHPHNTPLLLLTEFGMPATFLLMAALMWEWLRGIATLREVRDTNTAMLPLGFFGGVTAAVVHSMVSGVTVMPLSLGFLVLVAGAFLGQIDRLVADCNANSRDSHRPVRQYFAGVRKIGWSVAALCLLAGGLQTLGADIQNRECARMAKGHALHWPTLWLGGEADYSQWPQCSAQ